MTYFRIRWGDGTRLFRVEDSGGYPNADNSSEIIYFIGRLLDLNTGDWCDRRRKVFPDDVVDWNARW